MIHQLGVKLRTQLHGFSGELCKGLGKVRLRFVEEMLYGIQSRGSVKLTEIARSLEEPISLKKTHTRLDRNLRFPEILALVSENLLGLGSVRIGRDTLLILDLSDISKKYAEKMEYLCEVWDGSEGKVGRGYWLCEVIGAEVGSFELTPLVHRLWSSSAAGHVSENREILEVIELVCSATEGRGIWVIDRGGDRNELYDDLLDRGRRFIIRQRGDRNVVYRGHSVLMRDLAARCPMLYQEVVVKEESGQEKVYRVELGYLKVSLPLRPELELWLVVVKGFGEEPLLLLTTEAMRKSRKVVVGIMESYFTRWRVEDTARFIKQSYQLEDVRVLSYERLKNLALLVFAAFYFGAVYLGRRSKLKILVAHCLAAGKRLFGIPDFRYYALADGIKTILTKSGGGILTPRNGNPRGHPQMSLFTL